MASQASTLTWCVRFIDALATGIPRTFLDVVDTAWYDRFAIQLIWLISGSQFSSSLHSKRSLGCSLLSYVDLYHLHRIWILPMYFRYIVYPYFITLIIFVSCCHRSCMRGHVPSLPLS